MTRSYPYAGPSDLRDLPPQGRPIADRADLAAFLSTADPGSYLTYVIDLAGRLRLAPRQAEHVACASGSAVLAAGEIAFSPTLDVDYVSNQSTGYRPDAACWSAVASALAQLGVGVPLFFTAAFGFVQCGQCGQLTMVEASLPLECVFGCAA